jgi:hypothetical protein
MEQMSNLPPKPQSSVQETPDIAIAKTISKLTSKDVTIEMLGNIDNYDDVMRLGLFISMGTDSDLKVDWLKDFAYTELALTDSLRTKAGGIRSEHLVKITKAPDMIPQQQEGLIGRIRNRLTGR